MGRRRAWARRTLPTAVVAVLLLARPTRADVAPDDAPSDVRPAWAPGAESTLPPPPEGYATERRGTITWTFPESARHVAEDLQEEVADAWARVTRELGGDIEAGAIVRVARNPEHMRALAPVGAPPPPYATGVTYPAHGLVLLTLTAPESWARPDVEQVLVHELSHLALFRAVGGARLPRWFIEGVAIHQAEEQSLDRVTTLWNGSLQDRLLPLAELDRRFPSRPHEVNLAYAQAADLVAYLWNMEQGPVRFRRLIRFLREGRTFEEALDQAYFMRLPDLEREWRASVAERRRSVPLLVGGSTVWVLAGFLAYLAWRKRRAQFRREVARLGREEAALDRLETLVEDKLREVRQATMAASTPAPPPRTPAAAPPLPRDSEVPTVVHEGESHTLH